MPFNIKMRWASPCSGHSGRPYHLVQLYSFLEVSSELLLVDPHHLKAAPGRKTDVNDAEWIAELL
jgi:hypothetical protein